MSDCNNYTIIEKCLLCGFPSEIVLSIGETPLANAYPSFPYPDQETFPLNLMKCTNLDCEHCQLNCIVDENVLYSDYSYVTGDSPSNVKYFGKLVSYIEKTIVLDKENCQILDIGSNDGTTLSFFKEAGFKNLLGIDPAENIVELANMRGITTICEFFNETTSNKIKRINRGISFDLITCYNCFAHTANVVSILCGVKNILSPNGVFIFEVNNLIDILSFGSLDHFYLEHLQQYHTKAIVNLCQRNGMKVVKIDNISNQGGSLRVFVMHELGDPEVAFLCFNKEIIEQDNIQLNLNECEDLDFKIEEAKEKVEEVKLQLKKLLSKIKNRKMAIYGAPAKLTTLVKLLDLDLAQFDYVVDDSPIKQGKYLPGSSLPIVSKERWLSPENHPDFTLIAAWNMKVQIMEDNPIKTHWILPFPYFEVVPGSLLKDYGEGE